MKIEQQVCSRIQGNRLMELGIDCLKSHLAYCQYCPDPTGQHEGYVIIMDCDHHLVANAEQIAPAFSVAELGIMLPQTIQFQKTQRASIKITRMNAWTIYYNRHSSGSNVMMVENKNEAEARADALIYLLENKLVTAEDCNARLTA